MMHINSSQNQSKDMGRCGQVVLRTTLGLKKKMSSSTDEFLSLKYSIVRIPLKKRERERLLKHVRSTAPFLKKHIVKTMFCGHVLGKQFTGE